MLYPSPNRATLSILGLFEYDSDIFDNFALPDGVDTDTGDSIISNILTECADLELLYPNWDFMEEAIGYWSYGELPTWTKIWNLTQAEYNPIENYDRTENGTETENKQRNDSIENTSRGNSVNTNEDLLKVAGYNSDLMGNKNQTTQNGTSAVNNSGESTQTTTDNTGRVRSSRIHGNIGVTTTQQMMEQELNIAPKINFVNYVVNAFKQRFCLLVY